MIGTTLCVSLIAWFVVGNGALQLHWRILLVGLLVVFVVASLATTEIIPWHARSLVEWRQPKVLGSLTLLLLSGGAFVAGLANVFAPETARQDTLSEVAVAVGATPANAAERSIWERKEPGSCEAIEEYVARYPNGHFAREAIALLATRADVATGRLIVTSHELPLTEIPDGESRSSVALAQAKAIRRAERQGNRLCQLYAAEQSAKFVQLRVAVDRWDCSVDACGFEGRALCSIEHTEMRQLCGKAKPQ